MRLHTSAQSESGQSSQQRVTVAQAARHFNVDEVTIRRWIRNGCPCIRPGQRGPGRGALLDLQQVAEWRANTNVPGVLTNESPLPRIATALYETLTVEHADIRAGIDPASTAAVLIAAFERCCREFGKTYRFEQLPQPIRTLMSEL